MNDDGIFIIIDTISDDFKIKNPYTKIIEVITIFVLISMLIELITKKVHSKKKTYDKYDSLYDKHREFDKYYEQVRDKLPKLQIDPIAMKKFEKDCKELQDYVDELYMYLLKAYNTTDVDEIDHIIVLMQKMIKRLDNRK